MTADVQCVVDADARLRGCKVPLVRTPDSPIMVQGCVFLAWFTLTEPLSTDSRCQHSAITTKLVQPRKKAQMFLRFPRECCMS